VAKYTRRNKIVPKGNGRCKHESDPRRSTFGYHCHSCGMSCTCQRCDGTGIDKFGAHCSDCANNYYVYGQGNLEGFRYSLSLIDHDEDD